MKEWIQEYRVKEALRCFSCNIKFTCKALREGVLPYTTACEKQLSQGKCLCDECSSIKEKCEIETIL